MSYRAGGLIQAADYNILATGSPDGIINHGVPNINTLLGSGFRTLGYNTDYPLLTTVPVGGTVTADNWSQMIDYITLIANHQATQIDTMPIPVTGDTIESVYTIQQNVNRIYAKALDCRQSRTNPPNYWEYALTGSIPSWKEYAQIQVTVTFLSGDALRAFFNRGGSININSYYNSNNESFGGDTNKAAVSTMMQYIGYQAGTLYLTGAPSRYTILADYDAYSGISQTLGSAGGITTDPRRVYLNKQLGYPDLRIVDQVVLRQMYTPSSSDLSLIPSYTDSYLLTTVRSNGPIGQSGDNGNSVIFTFKFYQAVTKGSASPQFTFQGPEMSVNANVTIAIPPSTFLNTTTPAPTVTAIVSGQ